MVLGLVILLLLIGLAYPCKKWDTEKEKERQAWFDKYGELVTARVIKCKRVSSSHNHPHYYYPIDTSYTEFVASWIDPQDGQHYTFVDRTHSTCYSVFREGDPVTVVFDRLKPTNFLIQLP